MRTSQGIGRRLDRLLQNAGLKSTLRIVAPVLDRLTPAWALGGGSCLGYVRNGRPLPGDLDIGIYDPEFDLRRLARELPVIRYLGIRERWVTQTVVPLETKTDIYIIFHHEGRAAGTLFNDDRNEVKFLLYPRDIFEAGVERALVCGVECNVLKRAHEYCRAQYGDAYIAPEPGYNWWDSPRSGVLMTNETMFVEDVPRAAVPRRLRWAFQPTRAARKVLGHVSRLAHR
jgi:hypothetical protein